MAERMNPTFRGVRTTREIRAQIDNGTPESCAWEIGDRKYIPEQVTLSFGDCITTVYVSGRRVPKPSCGCDCHPKRDEEDRNYSVTYYPGNPSKQPPAWIWDWAQRAMGGVR